MNVYRQQRRTEASESLLRRVQEQLTALRRCARPSRDDLLHALIDAGEWASATADARLPHGDTVDCVADNCLGVVVHIATACDAEWRGDWGSVHPALDRAAIAAHWCTPARLPAHIPLAVSEGFAYYALSPHLYGDAARRWAARQAPRVAWCIGLRTIGLTLAATVAAALQRLGVAAHAASLRPTGDPHDRTVVIGDALAQTLRSTANAWWLVVDEGPGLSGSSMAGAARALCELGIPPARIVLMPSYRPDLARLASGARTVWQRHSIEPADYDRTWMDSARLPQQMRAASVVDIAGGRWRVGAHLHGTAPAAHPEHERRKYIVDRNTHRAMLKFSGYGHYGRTLFARAAQAAEDGWAPSPSGLDDGWIEFPWLDEPFGVPAVTANDLARLGGYLAFIGRTRQTASDADLDHLTAVTQENLRRCGGASAATALESLPIHAGPCVVTDGHLRRHEWVRRGATLQKTDGIEHGDDHFFPGPCDIAWDVAGAIAEWQLDAPASAALIDHYVRASSDRDVARRLPFYHLAYRAFRAAYTAFCRDHLAGTPEAARFAAEHEQYRRQLELTVACAC